MAITLDASKRPRSAAHRLRRLPSVTEEAAAQRARPRAGLRGLYYASPLYGLILGRPKPRELAATPLDAWPGRADRGAALVDGDFAFAGESLRTAQLEWEPPSVDRRYLIALHSFDWLRDLRALGTDDARRRTRGAIEDWIQKNDRWHPLSWRADVMGARITNWLAMHDFHCASATDTYRRTMCASIARQMRHLQRHIKDTPPGPGEFLAFKGAIYGMLAFAEPRQRIDALLARLSHVIDRQILPDGGHVQRNPTAHLEILRHLIDLRTFLRKSRAEVPDWLQAAIDKMTPALRFFLLGDKRLALFNGSALGDPLTIDAVLRHADATGKPVKSSRHSGFERVVSGRTIVVMDVGGPATVGYDTGAHAGLGSFELSVGRERLVVNCGGWHGARNTRQGAAWFEAMRCSAAHSCLTLADENPFGLDPGRGTRWAPVGIEAERFEEDGRVLIELSHQCYRRDHGVTYRRRLFLADGGDVRGEDRLTPIEDGPRPDGGQRFDIRFHLHPGVQASLTNDGASVLLRLPSGSGWRFRAAGAATELEASVYCGEGELRRTEQIVLSGFTAKSGDVIRWAFSREARP